MGVGFLAFGFLAWAYYLHAAYRRPDVPGSTIGAVLAAVLGAFGLHSLLETGQLPWLSAWHVGVANAVWIVTAYPLAAIAAALGDRRHEYD